MRSWKSAAAALALACAAGCRTTEEVLHDYEANISNGQYAAPISEMKCLADKGDDSQLLWRLMTGAAQYMADDKAGALASFDAAEDVFAQNDRTSVFARGGEGAFAMMTNDRAFTYDGGGIDRVFTCLYKAIDFMCEGKPDLARVELNRASQYQSNWIADRRKDIEAADNRMRTESADYAKSQNTTAQGDYGRQTTSAMGDASFRAMIREKCNFDTMTSGRLDTLGAADYTNPYASHVTGVFRWINGDGDRNHLREAAACAPNCRTVVQDYAESRQGGKPMNQVWIWAEDGLCPCREEWRLDLPLIFMPFVRHYLPYVGMALPVLRERSKAAATWRVTTSGGEDARMDDVADVDKLVKVEYDVYMRGAIAREITRTMVRAGVQVALGVTADNVRDNYTRIALKASQLGVAAWARLSTAADLRSWTALPKTVKAVRVARPADGRIDVWADGQKIQLSLEPGNTLVFIRKPGPFAVPVIKQVTFKR